MGTIRASYYILLIALVACTSDHNTDNAGITASVFDSNHVELPFSNDISSDTLSVFDYHYLYNGGGVGVADFNNDGYKDIFLGGNLVSSALLLGKGDLNFDDVTEKAGLITDSWINGVSIVDINHDGKDDIYLSVGGPGCDAENCQNLLYINNSSPAEISFVEAAADYNLALSHYSQQGLFIDVDLDGDLDLYLLQNHVDPTTKNYPKPKQYFSKASYDKLLINQEVETGTISFIDHSSKWGVDLPGFGLGIVSTDFNGDGYPDIYVANDFISDDILYINVDGQKFIDQSKELLKHTSYNSMGVDIGDVNGDDLADIMVVDMLPYENYRQKTMLGSMNYDKYLLSIKEKYNKQYIKNTLQLHRGHDDKNLSMFTDAANYYRVADTDWSWSPIIMDFDNDQHNDIYVSNGYGKNITDLDFVNYNSNLVGFGDKSKIEAQIKKDVSNLPEVKLPNHLYMNNGKGFTRNTSFQKTITNGVAYSDLDNDGDLDLVLNNLNDQASLLRNNSTNNYLKINLFGPTLNPKALGASVTVTLSSGKELHRDLAPVRSYLSCMDAEMVFGLGQDTVQTITIKWPDNKTFTSDTTLCNTTVTFAYQDIVTQSATVQSIAASKYTLDTVLVKNRLLQNGHDFSIQPLLFKSCQNENIKMAMIQNEVAIANADKNIYLLSQGKEKKVIHEIDQGYVTDLIAHDLTQNGTDELIIATTKQNSNSSISVLTKKDTKCKQEYTLDLDKGEYRFHVNKDQIFISKFPSADSYPQNIGANLFSLQIDNKGLSVSEFELDLSKNECITDLVFSDLNDDGFDDLVIVGEWMPVTIFWNGNNGYNKNTTYDKLRGMWQGVTVADLDRDGDKDLLLANLGTNTSLQAGSDNPIQIVCSDLDDNGSIDPLMSRYNERSSAYYSYSSRDDIAKKLPVIKQSFKDYQSFAKATFTNLLASFNKKAETKHINILESIILENKGQGKFEQVDLPQESQLSIINQFELLDYNHDELLDVIALTNNENVEIHNGNIDGLNCMILENRGGLKFSYVSNTKSGLSIPESTEDFIPLTKSSYLISSSKNVYSLNSNYE